MKFSTTSGIQLASLAHLGRDAYDSYLPQVFGLVRKEATADEIVTLLNSYVKERMGLTPDSERTYEVAEIMLQWRDWIYNNV